MQFNVREMWRRWNLRQRVLAAGGGVVLLAGLAMGAKALCALRTYYVARGLAKDGFPSLAAEAVDPHLLDLASTEAGCKLMSQIYFTARRQDRLMLVVEACTRSRHDGPEIQMARATVLEGVGSLEAAAQTLDEGAKRFNLPVFYVKLAQLLQRQKIPDKAREMIWRSVEMAPADVQLLSSALQFFADMGAWADAKRVAEALLKQDKVTDPGAKLFMARALFQGGDQEAGRRIAAQVEAAWKSQGPTFERLKGTYPELFSATYPAVSGPPGSKKQ